jgi:hypothetical protein
MFINRDSEMKIIDAPSMLIFSVALLSACGGGSGGDSSTTAVSSSSSTVEEPIVNSVSGAVADGYLAGANVCLDTNNDRSCLGEDTTVLTDNEGKFSIDTTEEQSAQFPIISVVIEGSTTDSDRITVANPTGIIGVGEGYYLMSPPALHDDDGSKFISPLTTLVENQRQRLLAENPNAAARDILALAVAEVSEQLGLSASPGLQVSDDYIVAKNGRNRAKKALAAKAHTVARVVAGLLADVQTEVASAVNSGGLDKSLGQDKTAESLALARISGRLETVTGVIETELQILDSNTELVNDQAKYLSALAQVIAQNIEDNDVIDSEVLIALVIQGSIKNHTAVINSVPELDASQGSNYSYQISARDKDKEDLIYSALALPSWLSFDINEGLLAGVPSNDDVGSHDVSLQVSDGFEGVKQDFTITVANVNDAPTGDVVIKGSVVEGATLTADVTALVDIDGLGDLSYQWAAAGVDIEDETASTYVPRVANLGQSITVISSYTDDGGARESVTSMASEAIEMSPGSPRDLVVQYGDSKVTLTWGSVAHAITYNVYYASESFVETDISNYASLDDSNLVSNLTSGSEVAGLTNGVKYYFLVTALFSGKETADVREVTVFLPTRNEWLASAALANIEASANLNTINSSYSTSAYPGPGSRIAEDKYILGRYNSNDTSSDSKLFVYNPKTKTSLVEISTGAIERPWLLHDISGVPVIYDVNKVIVVDGQAYSGGNSVATLNVDTNAIIENVVPYASLNNASSHMMHEHGFIDGDTVTMSMLYRNNVGAPGIWVIDWNIAKGDFSHFDFTSSVTTALGATFSTRINFVTKGKDDDHLLVGVHAHASGSYYVLELQKSTQNYVRSIKLNDVTGDSGYYEPLLYQGDLYMIPRAETGDASGMNLVKIDISSFTGSLIAIDSGAFNNSKRVSNNIHGGFSQMPSGETGLFVARNVNIKGSQISKQFVMMLDLTVPIFYTVGLNSSNFQKSISDSTNDSIHFSGLAGQNSGHIIAATYWRDASITDHNAQSLRNRGGIYHGEGSEQPSEEN